VSIFMRFVVIIGRSIALLTEAWVYLLGVILWILLPPIALILALQGGVAGIIRGS
jgi:hypothetical protein